MKNVSPEDWQWEGQMQDANNKTVSRICATRLSVNIFNKNDWPAIISFFKQHLIALDAFWSAVKFGLEE